MTQENTTGATRQTTGQSTQSIQTKSSSKKQQQTQTKPIKQTLSKHHKCQHNSLIVHTNLNYRSLHTIINKSSINPKHNKQTTKTTAQQMH